jgi:cytosine/adenosine deaminase-related metal-dependent hydrolase
LFSLHASFTVSDELIREVKRVAEKFHSPITIHASEGLVDLNHNLERYGKRTIERLHDLGLLGPNVVLAHCVHVSEEEIDLISQTNTGVAHNPMSNMLNAVGVSPVTRMLQRGINIGLGNDGYIFDMFENMRAAFLLHRVHTRNPNALDPYTVLEMATINGARLYGIDTEVGSIEIGKKADVIVVRPSILPTPLNAESAIGHIINTASADDVEQVFFGGEPLVRNKHLESVDEEKAEQISQDVAGKLWERLKTVRPHLDTVMQD